MLIRPWRTRPRKRFNVNCNSIYSSRRTTISGFKIELDLVQRIIKDYSILSKSGKTIVLCWIPSHVGISGNEKSDTAAKSALSLRVTPMKIPAADLLPRVTMLISENWQQFWNSCTGNKLQAIRPAVGGHQPKSSLSRRVEVVVNRLRIGHTRCTHSYLLTGADQPECSTCQCPLTVKHF